jgi:hypothetical protein
MMESDRLKIQLVQHLKTLSSGSFRNFRIFFKKVVDNCLVMSLYWLSGRERRDAKAERSATTEPRQ